MNCKRNGYMARFTRSIVLISLTLIISACGGGGESQTTGSASTASSSTQSVGIPSQSFDFVAATQRNTNWCWAASIQMILNYYGIAVSQEEIVARTYGVDPYGLLPDFGGSIQTITANLNTTSVDDRGRYYQVIASVGAGAPIPSQLLQELSTGHPVVVAYASSSSSGHAVVATGATYTRSTAGPIVQTIVVRDPWPSPENLATNGRVEYSAAQFAANMQAYWFVRVQ